MANSCGDGATAKRCGVGCRICDVRHEMKLDTGWPRGMMVAFDQTTETFNG